MLVAHDGGVLTNLGSAFFARTHRHHHIMLHVCRRGGQLSKNDQESMHLSKDDITALYIMKALEEEGLPPMMTLFHIEI